MPARAMHSTEKRGQTEFSLSRFLIKGTVTVIHSRCWFFIGKLLNYGHCPLNYRLDSDKFGNSIDQLFGLVLGNEKSCVGQKRVRLAFCSGNVILNLERGYFGLCGSFAKQGQERLFPFGKFLPGCPVF